MGSRQGSVSLDRATGEALVEYARAVIEAVVGDDSPPEPPDIPILEEHRGVFVTLEKHGELRGCIGRPMPQQPLGEGLRAAATGAATADPRFPPLDPAELQNVMISVSVLTPPSELSPPDPDAIDVGRDGLIVSKGQRTGLLLPQVAIEQGWTPEAFLRGTARKAGLPPDAWREEATSVECFSAQVFTEESPAGTVSVVDYVSGEHSTEQATD